MKKILCVILAAITLMACASPAFAIETDLEPLKAKFADGEGPEVAGVSIDYVYYTPEKKDDTKYPLVIWLHGMGQGKEKRAQIGDNNFPLWASDEFQSRFTPSGGAYLLAARSHEENGKFWPNDHLAPLKAAIDEFIAEHDDIDVTRIYIGGFSMGGQMTLKMIASYPGLFAAAFPMCPAYTPSDDEVKAIANLPVWISVSRFDVIAGYYTNSKYIWDKLCEYTNLPEDCRLSSFGKVCYGNGKKTPSNHHVWFAVANNMFMDDGSDYVNMETFNAAGETIDLEYPDGMISWLCKYTSDYSGEELASTNLPEQNNQKAIMTVVNVLKALFWMFVDTLFIW